VARESKRELAGRVIYAARAAEAATQKFDSFANRALGINETDARCLNIVDNEGGTITAGRLAELSGLTTAAVTGVLDRVEAKGYARRVRDPGDRRRVLVELTPRLRERMEVIWGPLAAEADAIVKRYSADDLRLVMDWYEASREANERHAERIRDVRFD